MVQGLDIVIGMFEVYTGKRKISRDDLFAHVSQCVAVGTLCERARVGAIAHVHSHTDHERLLDDMFEALISVYGEVKEVYVVGGANTFVPGHGPIWGERTVGRVTRYLSKNLSRAHVNYDVIGSSGNAKDLVMYTSLKFVDVTNS